MVWKEIVKLALLGTERSELSESAKKALTDYGIDVSKNTTQVVLEGAALLFSLQKVGFQPTNWTENKLSICESEDLKPCSPQSVKHLNLIFKGQYSPAFDEFIELLSLQNKCLPPLLLPELFDKSLKDELLWQKVKPVIGKRGIWLINLNPSWQSLHLELSSKNWKFGTRTERVNIVKETRQKNPKHGLELLLSTWEEDGLQDKVAFLKCLEASVSDTDEGFLEKLLDSTRKEIWEQAVFLLSHLKNSAFQERIFFRAISFFDDTQGGLAIKIPKINEKDFAKEGINPRFKFGLNNEQESILYQLFSKIPPEKWENHFQKTPEVILNLFAQNEYGVLLIEALIQATLIYSAPNWLEAIVLFWLENFHQPRWSSINMKLVLNQLPEKLFNDILFEKLMVLPLLPDEHSPLIQMLQTGGWKWEDRLAKRFFVLLKEWFARRLRNNWDGYQYKNVLAKAAYFINPKLEKELKDFSDTFPNVFIWQKELNIFFDILRFRKEMIAALVE